MLHYRQEIAMWPGSHTQLTERCQTLEGRGRAGGGLRGFPGHPERERARALGTVSKNSEGLVMMRGYADRQIYKKVTARLVYR